MRHDIYSVGVVLLEIGLWQPFVNYSHVTAREEGFAATATPADALTRGLFDSDGVAGAELMRDPDRVKAHFLSLAQTTLRRKMGTRYSRVVETCLTCLDEENEDFGDEREFFNEDGVAFGVRFIEKVVARLGQISV